MTKHIIASVLAATFVLTPVTAPQARAADAGEIGRFLLGAGVLLALGSALSNQSSSSSSSSKATHSNKKTFTVTRQAPVRTVKPVIKPAKRNVVPSACLSVNNSDFGPKRFFGQRCLRNNMRNVSRLPTGCLRNVYTTRGYRAVYAAHCLRRSGWVVG